MTGRRKWIVGSCAGLAALAVLGGVFLFARGSLNLSSLPAKIRSEHPEVFRQIKDAIIQNDEDVAAIGQTLDLPFFRLILSRKDIAHFVDLYEHYENRANGAAYYAEHNLWRNAKLEFQGKTYRVRVKSHGRNPTNHRNGKHISLSIRLRDDEQIFGSTRFSLLVRAHFKPDKQIVFDLADDFGLIKNHEQLVRVAINNWEEKLYFFDRRFNDKYMEVEKRPSLRLFGYAISDYQTNKSSIHTDGVFDPAEYESRFRLTLTELEYPPAQHDPLCARFLKLNRAIAAQNFEVIPEYFDLDYLSSFEAVRMLAGLNGHSLGRPDNLYLFYDTASGLFYPAITRDASMTAMPYVENGSPELLVNTMGIWELPLFRMISQHDELRAQTYQKIYRYLREHGKSAAQRHREIQERFEKLSYFGWATVGLRRLGVVKDNITLNNFGVLKKYLEHSAPKVLASVDANRLQLEVMPQSLSPVIVNQFRVASNNPLPRQVEVVLQTAVATAAGQENGLHQRFVVPCANGRIDLSSVLRRQKMSTALSKDLQRVPRKYVFHIQLLNPGVTLQARNVDIRLQNVISGQTVASVAEQIRKASVSALQYPAEPPSEQKVAVGRYEFLQQKGRLIIPAGDYHFENDFVGPADTKLVFEAGATIHLGADVALVSQAGVEVQGTSEKPVVVRAIRDDEPFGTLGVLGDASTNSVLRHLHVSNGRERWVDGVYFSGTLSIHYNGKVTMEHCVVEGGRADDGLNIKYGEVDIRNCTFQNNAADQVDLDICTGTISESRFSIDALRDANGDGLDVSGSVLEVSGSVFVDLQDKGMSVGEASHLTCDNNRYLQNTVGMAVKDKSIVKVVNCEFDRNTIDIDLYRKKAIFGGGVILFETDPAGLTLFADDVSAAYVAPGEFNWDEALSEVDALEWPKIQATHVVPFWRPAIEPAAAESVVEPEASL